MRGHFNSRALLITSWGFTDSGSAGASTLKHRYLHIDNIPSRTTVSDWSDVVFSSASFHDAVFANQTTTFKAAQMVEGGRADFVGAHFLGRIICEDINHRQALKPAKKEKGILPLEAGRNDLHGLDTDQHAFPMPSVET